jgi:hypothetical protein
MPQLSPRGTLVTLANTQDISTPVLNFVATPTPQSPVLSPNQQNLGARGLKVVIDVTALTGAAGITVTIQGYDCASWKYYSMLSSTNITAVGTTVLNLYPGAANTANLSVNDQLPEWWRLNLVLSGVGTITATVGGCYLM